MDHTPRALPRFHLGWIFGVTWILVWLHAMFQSGWDFTWAQQLSNNAVAGVMMFGAPYLHVQAAHGSAVPWLVNEGEWHRLLLDGLIEGSLIGLLFGLWSGRKLLATLHAHVGLARGLVVALAGGVGAAAATAWQFPDGLMGGAGALGIWMGPIGWMAAVGCSGNTDMHRRLRRTAIRWVIGLVIFSVVITIVVGGDLDQAAALAWPGFAGGILGGVVTTLLLGLGRTLRVPTGLPSRLASLACVGVIIVACAIQVPRALTASAWPERAEALVSELKELEAATRRAIRWRKPKFRLQILTQLQRIRDLPWLEEWSGRGALDAWLKMFEPWTPMGQLRDPDRHLRIVMPEAWARWHPVESRLRIEGNQMPRSRTLPKFLKP